VNSQARTTTAVCAQNAATNDGAYVWRWGDGMYDLRYNDNGMPSITLPLANHPPIADDTYPDPEAATLPLRHTLL